MYDCVQTLQTCVYDTLKVHNNMLCVILNNILNNSSNYNDLSIVLKFNNCQYTMIKREIKTAICSLYALYIICSSGFVLHVLYICYYHVSDTHSIVENIVQIS